MSANSEFQMKGINATGNGFQWLLSAQQSART
jgi:hypothetical protein